MSSYNTSAIHTDKMPPGIPYIIGNEAAERFSFYGMRTILTIFMVNYLWLMGDKAGTQMADTEATERFHHFVSLVYLTPVLGALLADLFFGKYRVIMTLSVVYCLGHLALALMGMTGEASTWLMAGLWLIAVGSGGIKPCVSAHVGDQFGNKNRNLLPRIFNWFYWSINLGAFLSTLLTPWLLEWYGPHLAFGIPGVLMALATLVFWTGRHKFVHIPPGGKKFQRELLSKEGIGAILKLAAIYIFVAIFWALFDQSGSSWVLQAENMNRNWLGVEWLPSQIQALNPIFILIFIPLFSYVIYPLVDRVFTLTPLRKIGIGFFIMVISFALVSIAQMKIDAGEAPSISWQLFAYVALTASEVMVSIVCLEFSYTQAPKAMKSVIMALFLFAVSLGNQVTAQINHFIQVKDPTTVLSGTDTEISHGGFDGKTGTSDDLVVTFDKDGARTSIAFDGKSALEELVSKVSTTVAEQNHTVLSEAKAAEILAGAKDPWGNPYQFTLLDQSRMRIVSTGADKKDLTQWDQGAIISVSVPSESKPSAFTAFMDNFRPEEAWLEVRKKELGIPTKAEAAAEGPVISTDYFVGGRVRLEGANYFWFFTGLMLVASLAFMIVAKLYRPREYYHDDHEAEVNSEATAH